MAAATVPEPGNMTTVFAAVSNPASEWRLDGEGVTEGEIELGVTVGVGVVELAFGAKEGDGGWSDGVEEESAQDWEFSILKVARMLEQQLL